MKILYIDLETTGLNPVHDQVLEIGMVIDDLANQKPLNELPSFQGLIHHPRYSGHPKALAMNAKLLEAIANYDAAYTHFDHDEVADYAETWLNRNWQAGKSLNIGGKNVAKFDVPFLKTLLRITQDEPLKIGEYSVKQRAVDPGMLYLRMEDDCVPDLNTCLERAGIAKRTNHTAIDDCLLVAELIRKRYE